MSNLLNQCWLQSLFLYYITFWHIFLLKSCKDFGCLYMTNNVKIEVGGVKNTYELLNLRALEFIHIFQFMGKIFCVEFQRVPLKFHTKYLTHTLKDNIFVKYWNFQSSYSKELISIFETPPGHNVEPVTTAKPWQVQICDLTIARELYSEKKWVYLITVKSS